MSSSSSLRLKPGRWLSLVVALATSCSVVAVRAGAPLVTTLLWASLAFFLGIIIMRDPRYGLYAMLFALPLELAGRLTEGPYVVTVYHVTLLLTIVSWGTHRLRRSETSPVEFSLLHAGVFALLGAALWSLPFSLDPPATAIAIIRLAFLTAFFMLFAHLASDSRTMDRILAVMVATATASGGLAVLQFLLPGVLRGEVHVVPIDGGVFSRPAALFGDPNYLAGFLSVAIIAAVARAVHAPTLRHAVPWLGGALVSGAGLIVTLSRTGWVGVAVGLLVCVFTAPRGRRPRLIAALALGAVLVVALAPGLILGRLGSIGDVQTDPSVGTRVAMYRSTLEIIRDHAVFGTGLAAFEQAYPAYQQPGTLGVVRPHQLPLALPAEMGVMGLLAELLIIAGVIRSIARRRHAGWNAWEGASVAGLASMTVQSLFQYYLYFEYLWLLLALVLAATRFGPDPDAGDLSRRVPPAVGGRP